MSSNQLRPNGAVGILRSNLQKSNNSSKIHNESRPSGRVTFSSNVQTSTQHPFDDEEIPGNNTDDDNGVDDHNNIQITPTSMSGAEVDSDDEDVILASGDALSMDLHDKTVEKVDNAEMDDAAVHSTLEIVEAKRKRGRARRNESDGNYHEYEMSCHGDDQSLSLITDRNADPDYYESNAGGNASCPVEPFNMDAEKESGMGYFDGDTYVFRQKKPIEDEDDAWLDGFDYENEEQASSAGGLDSTPVWKPTDVNGKIKEAKATKYVNEYASHEDIGKRLATLLHNKESVMAALSRHGSTLRDLTLQKQRVEKKRKINNRKQLKLKKDTVSLETQLNNSADEDSEMIELTKRMKETRDLVEELTELADTLLFQGEPEAYELTKADWIHRFKLEGSCNVGKRLVETVQNDFSSKKPRHDYFNSIDCACNNVEYKKQVVSENPSNAEIMWEYRGNEDGAIHGPFTSLQMLEWTSHGYFLGANAVDVRRVDNINTTNCNFEEKEVLNDSVHDLLIDLMDDDVDNVSRGNGDNTKMVGTKTDWMRSDEVDFSSY